MGLLALTHSLIIRPAPRMDEDIAAMMTCHLLLFQKLTVPSALPAMRICFLCPSLRMRYRTGHPHNLAVLPRARLA
eukprot:824737-Amphidinium_carterae.1